MSRSQSSRSIAKKSKIGHNNKCAFLGFTFYSKGRIRWTDEAFVEFKHRIRKLTGRSWGVSLKHRIAELNRYITGWFNYFGISQYYVPIEELDGWIRRRIRMCLWKQWRYARQKITELRKLGVSLPKAIASAFRPCSYWAASKQSAAHMGLTNEYLHHVLGLVSTRKIWISLHYSS